MQVALIAPSGQTGNAIGQQLAAKLAFFLERGALVQVFLESAERLRPDLGGHVRATTQVENAGPVWDFLAQADLVIADYPQTYPLLNYLPLLAGKKPKLVLDYHGVTPGEFWQGPQRELMQRTAKSAPSSGAPISPWSTRDFAQEELHEATGYPPRASSYCLIRPTAASFIRARDKRTRQTPCANACASRMSESCFTWAGSRRARGSGHWSSRCLACLARMR